MSSSKALTRMAVDIGGTFTDIALEIGPRRISHKILTTPRAPEQGVMDGVAIVFERAGLQPNALDVFVHGTTLATNAIIERKGARTALVTTDGFRDALEMAYEHRFEQYDVMIDKPSPLVPRELRFGVPERIDARGRVLLPLDENAVRALAEKLKRTDIESLAIGLLHSYVDAAHERRVRDIFAAAMPGLSITLSSDVCPEMREYERLSTACANAYVQPVMAGYLGRLENALRASGLACPIYLMTSGGGLTTIDMARRYPIRLVESGPAGGAILAAQVAGECGLSRVLSFDMGGTTAKICLLDDGEPQHSRTFEVARQYRFQKGSGLPLRIPVIEMVEIGAGGGSIAAVDAMRRINVGPESAGSEPGPACYGRGGTFATVTDADVVLGRIDPEHFAGGSVQLRPARSTDAVGARVGGPLGLGVPEAAFGICEVVEENMANAARVHAVERGKELGDRTLIAFGGAAPLHAVRLAEKLGIDEVIVPTGAGVGSAVGFLAAPVAYEVVRSRYMRLSGFEAAPLNTLFGDMHAEAKAVVEPGARGGKFNETRTADMRYRGQGHEISVAIPVRRYTDGDAATFKQLFETAYTALFGRTIPDLDVEILSWTVRLADSPPSSARAEKIGATKQVKPRATRSVFDPVEARFAPIAVYHRDDLAPGDGFAGPAIVVEAETSTYVGAAFVAQINSLGYIVATRRRGPIGSTKGGKGAVR
ncbi:MAG: hydantoinase/oxoprolinase family protein [Alphaproteobacteria bacterium]